MGVEEGGNGGSGTAAAAREGRMRIYVGGLGESVSADDLKRTFSAPHLGNVDSVEIVRTKGRSFAYLDFLRVSDKGLAKLFSTYNGCMWKGGRLRLEKAKEHYLLRLKREWAEDAEVSSDSKSHNVVAVKNPHSSEKLLKVCNSEKQLHIFFPKLRKVKPLPFKGTGKHKYSFQHIEVPSLPIHFCDCEEHCTAFEPGGVETSANQEKESGGMNDEELSMMNSIMRKNFQRESCLETASRTDEFAREVHNSTSLNDVLQFDDTLAASRTDEFAREVQNSTSSNDDLQFDDTLVDQDSDEDNLIINVVAGSKSNSKIPLSSIRGPKAVTANQDSQASKTRSVQRTHRSQGRMLSSNKKRKEPHAEEAANDTLTIAEKKAKTHNSSDDLEIIRDNQRTIPRPDIRRPSDNPVRSQKSAPEPLVSDGKNASFRISDITSDIGLKAEAPSKSDNSNLQRIVEEENHTTEPFRPAEENRSVEVVSDVPNAEINKSSKSTSWLQKSSWMQLVGSSTDSSFSISQILPGLNVEKHELQPLKGTDSSIPVNGNHHNFFKTDGSVSLGDVSKSGVKEGKVSPSLDGCDQSNPAKKLQASGVVNDASTSSPSKKHPFQPKQTSGGSTRVSENFTFMRSAASMKEWMKTKAALSGSLKKKRNEK